MDQQTSPTPNSLAIGGMLALVVAMGIGRFVYTPILPMMVEELDLSASQAGMIASSNFVGYLIGALIAALPILKTSRRQWMIAALFGSALTTLLMGWADGYLQFIVLRFAGGVLSAWVLVLASALIIDRLVSQGKGYFAAIHFAGVGAGIVVASLLTTGAAIAAGGWRSAWQYNGAMAMLLALAAVFLLRSTSSTTSTKPVSTGVTQRSLKWLLYAYGLFGFGYVITATFIIQMVRDSNFSLAVETWVWVLVGIAAMPSVWLWNKIAGHLGNSRVFAIACICEAIGVAASVLVTNLTGLIFAAIFLGGTFMGITALGLVEARARASDDPGRALALMTAAFGLGQIIGPIVAGYLHDTSGSFFIPSLLACAALVLASILVQIRHQTE